MLKFEEPDVTSFVEFEGPIAIANKKFPYHEIDDRRFEELVYSIFKIKIDRKEFLPFNKISLMTGVRDQGRDCVIYEDYKATGVIQCKKYKNPYSRSELGQEVTKFILYSMLDGRLVHDYATFTYYICTANGLTADCNEFVNDFNTVIFKQAQLDKWIDKSLEKPTLESLKLTLDRDAFKNNISKIKVKNITPSDLDIELTSPCHSHIIPLFFEVRTVVDNNKLDELKQLIKPTLTKEEILTSLRNSSVGLYTEKNEFNSIPNSHINRKETDLIYGWIKNENDKLDKHKNICLLVGSAGYGKTVILKDLYDKCIDSNIAVLGLKADKLYPKSLDDLQKNVNTPLPLLEFIQETKKHFSKVVILIDQVDALSQSMSSDRRFLNVFRSFIDAFLDDNNVKIILSVRPYELHYDPSLSFYKSSKTFNVNQLDKNEVSQVLKKAEINPETLSPKLLELLRVPNQLNVFLQIAIVGANRLQSISIHGLYLELWRQKIIEINNRTDKFENLIAVKKLLYLIANDMFAAQRISLSVFKYEDYHSELSYLESERLIKKEANQLQFFHQSFYDFIFSKQLVENEKDIIQYIKLAGQSIHIRSAVKMIFTYYRDYDESKYLFYLQSIFADDDILFHIKHVIFTLVVSLEEPSDEEALLIKSIITDNIHFELLFLEIAKGQPWFKVASDIGTLDLIKRIPSDTTEKSTDYRRKFALSFIQNQIINYNLKEAWEVLATITDKIELQNILYSVTDWSCPISFQLFESCEDFEKNDFFGYYHVLKNIVAEDEDYVIDKISNNLPNTFTSININSEYQRGEVLKTLVKQCPHKLYPILVNCVLLEVAQNERPYRLILVKDWIYNDVEFIEDEDNLVGSKYIYQLLAICVKRIAESNSNAFTLFFNEYKNSTYESILRLILFALQGSEERYPNQIVDLFTLLTESGIVEEDGDLEYELRTLITTAFKYFSIEQKNYILNYIKTLKRPKEISFRKYDESKNEILSYWGLAKYFWIQHLPKNIVEVDIELKMVFQELKRKHGDRKDKRKVRRPTAIIGIHSPINPTAYKHMSKEQWFAAFKKYDSTYKEGFGSSKGGMHELVSGFRYAIEENPSNEKLFILTEMVKDKNIDINYIFTALQALTEKRKDLYNELIELLKITVSRKQHTSHYYPIRIAGILIGAPTVNPYVLALLTGNSVNFDEKKDWMEQKERDITTGSHGLITKAMNTNYGAAISALISIKDKNCENVIFETIETILESGPPDARALIFHELAYLTNLNVDRTNEIFVKYLTKEEDIYVIASSLWSLQYLRKKGFNSIGKAYGKLIQSNLLGKHDADSLFNLLYGSYLHGIEGAKELLYRLITDNKYAAIRSVGIVFKNYYSLPNTKEKNDELLSYILSETKIDEESDFSFNFLNIENILLEDIYSFLLNYIRSPLFVMSNYLIDYLGSQCAHAPLKAIELFNLAFEKRQINNIKVSHRIDESFIKFIVGGYDSLTLKNEEHHRYKHQLLISFDEILKDYKLRRSTDRILEKLI